MTERAKICGHAMRQQLEDTRQVVESERLEDDICGATLKQLFRRVYFGFAAHEIRHDIGIQFAQGPQCLRSVRTRHADYLLSGKPRQIVLGNLRVVVNALAHYASKWVLGNGWVTLVM